MQSFYALYYPSSVKKYTHFLFVEQQVKIQSARMVKAFIQALIPHSFFLAFIPPFLTPHFRCQIEGGKCLLRFPSRYFFVSTGFYLTLSAALLLFLPPVISAQNALSCYSSRITSKSDLIDTFWKMSKDSVPAGVLSTGNKKPDNVLRKKWIVNNLEKLKVFNPDKNTSVIQSREVDIEDFYQLSYRITSDEGFIVFGNGDWVYLRVHSSHEKEEIGDISMAIDNWGKLYLNLGHVCGGIIHYVTHKKLKVQSVDDFIQNFKSDTDDRPWILIDDYYNNFTYEKFN